MACENERLIHPGFRSGTYWRLLHHSTGPMAIPTHGDVMDAKRRADANFEATGSYETAASQIEEFVRQWAHALPPALPFRLLDNQLIVGIW